MSETSLPHHLFVYGTLLSTVNHPLGRRLRAGTTLIGRARVRGVLYLVESFSGPDGTGRPSYYPACVLSDRPDDMVQGELYAIHDPGILEALDAYEECGPGFPDPREYVRVPVEVETADRARVLAWVYLYNHPVDGLTQIPEGRWP
jgi:gamma-glutamylcyclotransferase (GGCT)/AIG2-like uncharacterized protein YtfP